MSGPRLTAGTTAGEVRRALEAHGYCIIERLQSEAVMDRILADARPYAARAKALDGEFFGGAYRKVEEMVTKSPAFAELLDTPLISAIAREILGDDPLLNATGVFLLDEGGRGQALHRDGSTYPLPRVPGGPEHYINMMWAIEEFTAENGATRVVPGSHLWPEGREPAPEDPIEQLTMPRGSVGMWLGSTYHGGGINRTPRARVGAEMAFALGWLRPYETPLLLVPPIVARDLPERVAAMLGYQSYKGYLGHVGGRNPMELLRPAAPAESVATEGIAPVPEEIAQAARAYLEQRGAAAAPEVVEAFERLAEAQRRRADPNDGVQSEIREIGARTAARALAAKLAQYA
jgi:ectoine hydroxylase-related dioxygenase (phytanoyl-CoA dioxygenase family)